MRHKGFEPFLAGGRSNPHQTLQEEAWLCSWGMSALRAWSTGLLERFSLSLRMQRENNSRNTDQALDSFLSHTSSHLSSLCFAADAASCCCGIKLPQYKPGGNKALLPRKWVYDTGIGCMLTVFVMPSSVTLIEKLWVIPLQWGSCAEPTYGVAWGFPDWLSEKGSSYCS